MSTVVDTEPLVELTSGSLRGRVAAAGIWSLMGYAATQLVRLGSNLLLTRLLFPEAFGAMAIVWAYLAGLVMFSDVGLWSYLLQSEKLDDRRFHDAIWSINLGRSLVVLSAATALACPIAWMYDHPDLAGMLVVASLGQFIAEFRGTKLVTAARDLKQKQLILFDFVLLIVNVTSTIVFAWVLRSAWAIVLGGIVSSLAFALGSQFVFPGPRNRWSWDQKVVRELRGFSFWIYLSSIMTFIGGQADRLILGKLVSMELLGLYGIAMTFAVLPLALTQQISKLISPIVVQLRHRQDVGIARKLKELRGGILRVGAVLVAGMSVFAPAFFGILYDSRYERAGILAAIVSLSIWLQILESSVGGILLAFGDARSTAMCSGARMIGMLAGVSVGFWAAGFYGFLLGTGTGALAVYAISVIQLRRHGIALGFQDLKYCAAAILLAAFGWGLSFGLSAAGMERKWASVCAATGVAVVGVMYLRPVLRSTFGHFARNPRVALLPT